MSEKNIKHWSNRSEKIEKGLFCGYGAMIPQYRVSTECVQSECRVSTECVQSEYRVSTE
jgi:hypothetical protein